MKILVISHRVPYPLKDGGVIAMHTLLHGLKNAGATVKLLCLNPNKDNVNAASLPSYFYKDFDFESVDVDTVPTALGAFANLFTKESYHMVRFYNKRFERLLQNVLNREEFDVISLESLFVTGYLPVIRKNFKGPVVMRAHNVEHRIWEKLAANAGNPLKKWYLNLLAQRLKTYETDTLQKLDAVMALTQEDADIFRHMGFKGPVHISPHGIDINQFNDKIQPTGEPDVFHLGSMDWIPNQEAMRWFLDEIWLQVVNAIPTAQFHLAGKKIPAWFNERKDTNVTIAGEVPNAAQFMANHHIMVVPLLSGSGIRVKILEGMALGKPIVATPIAAAGIEYNNGQNILIGESPAQIAGHIIELLKNPQQRETLGQNARRLIEEKYDNAAISKKLIEFFTSLSPRSSTSSE